MKVNIKHLAIIFSSTASLMTCSTFAGFNSAGCSYIVSSTAGLGSGSNATTDLSPTTWMNTGGWATPSSLASATWTNNVWGWNSATEAGFMSANMIIKNHTNSAQDFVFTAAMSGTAAGPFLATGSVAGQFLNASESLGMLTSAGPLWSALVDGSTVNSQLPNALVFAAPFQVASLGSFNFTNIAVSESIDSQVALRFAFRISAGGEANFVSNFSFQVPGPASLAFVALAPLFGSRRRR